MTVERLTRPRAWGKSDFVWWFSEARFFRLVDAAARKLWATKKVESPPDPRPADSTVEAFEYLIRLNEPKRLSDWLALRSPEEKAFFEERLNGTK